MSGIPKPRAQTDPWERQKRSGWDTYRRAIDLLERDEWAPALRLLAAAETEFRTEDDHDGLWRALSGQAVAHWGAGDSPLAVARATAALRAAESVSDVEGAGLTAWQLAVMLLSQGDYRRAAELLLRSEQALNAAQAEAPATEVGAAARLCLEILRWQGMVAQGLAERRTASEVVLAIQRDLAARLGQAAIALRALSGLASGSPWSSRALLLPVAANQPTLPEREAARVTLTSRLSRWWRSLTDGQAEGVALPPIAVPAPLPPATQRLFGPPSTAEAPEPAHTPQPTPSPEGAETAGPAQAPIEAAPSPAEARSGPRGARIAVTCFGSFRVTIDDRTVERWESGRARAIFKYLVVRNAAPVSKELLAELFWPESEPDLARRSLHQAIYCLRQSLKRVAPDLSVIKFADDCYQLSVAGGLWVDSEEFTRSIAEARARLGAGDHDAAMAAYAVAADLVRGEFLEEERYEAWAEELRHSYGAMYSEALHQLARHYHRRGDHATAALHCQRVLAHEPCDEEAHLMLMRTYVAQGLRHMAVRQYQLCVNALRNELDLAPSGELESFYRQVVAVE